MRVLIFTIVIIQSVFWNLGSEIQTDITHENVRGSSHHGDGLTLSRNLYFPIFPGFYPGIGGSYPSSTMPSFLLPPQMFQPSNTMLGLCNPYNPIGCQIMGLHQPISTGTSSTGQPVIMPSGSMNPGGFLIPITSTTTTTVTEEIIDGDNTN